MPWYHLNCTKGHEPFIFKKIENGKLDAKKKNLKMQP